MYLNGFTFQSTFPRGERRLSCDTWPRGSCISIHVPAWGTTGYCKRELLRSCISIHVPAWGTTGDKSKRLHPTQFQSTFPRGERLNRRKAYILDWEFQSTFPRGERRYVADYWNIPFIISIHVPAWGTTSTSCTTSLQIGYFNPRSRVGNDKTPRSVPNNPRISIHVPAWGTTVPIWGAVPEHWHFNPRSRVGNDGVELKSMFIRIYRNVIVKSFFDLAITLY